MMFIAVDVLDGKGSIFPISLSIILYIFYKL